MLKKNSSFFPQHVHVYFHRAIAGVASQANLGNLISDGNLRKGRALV